MPKKKLETDGQKTSWFMILVCRQSRSFLYIEIVEYDSSLKSDGINSISFSILLKFIHWADGLTISVVHHHYW